MIINVLIKGSKEIKNMDSSPDRSKYPFFICCAELVEAQIKKDTAKSRNNVEKRTE
jgi:hypothetical protein